MSAEICNLIAQGALQLAANQLAAKASRQFGEDSGNIMREFIRKEWPPEQKAKWEEAANKFQKQQEDSIFNELKKSNADIKKFADSLRETDDPNLLDVVTENMQKGLLKRMKDLNTSLTNQKEVLGLLSRSNPEQLKKQWFLPKIAWFSRDREQDAQIKNVLNKLVFRGEDHAENMKNIFYGEMAAAVQEIGKSAKHATSTNLKDVQKYMLKIGENRKAVINDIAKRKKVSAEAAEEMLDRGVEAGHSSDDAVIDIFSKLVKEMRGIKANILSDLGELADDPLEHITFRIDRTALEASIRNNGEEFMEQLDDMIDWEKMFPQLGRMEDDARRNYIEGFVQNTLRAQMVGIRQQDTGARARTLRRELGNTKIQLKEGRQLEAFKLLGDQGEGFTLSNYRHTISGIDRAASREKLGLNLRFQKKQTEEFIRSLPGFDEYYKNPTKSKNLISNLDEAYGRAEHRQAAAQDDEALTMMSIGDSMNMAISFMLTPMSLARNVVHDNGVYEALIKALSPELQGAPGVLSSIPTWTRALYHSLKNVGFRNPKLFLSELGKNTVGRSKKEQEALRMIEMQGLPVRMEAAALASGITKHVDATRASSGGILGGISRGVTKIAKWSHKLMGVQMFDQAVRNRNHGELGLMFNRVLEDGYDELTDAFQYELSRFGITRGEWDMLKRSSRFQTPGHFGNRQLGPDLRYDKMFENVPDNDFRALAVGGETPTDVKRRLTTNFRLFFRELLMERVATPNRSADVLRVQDIQQVGLTALLKNTFRFGNITVAQWQNGVRRMAVAQGLSKEAEGLYGVGMTTILQSLTSPQKGWPVLGLVLFYNIAGGMLSNSVNDVLNGYTPRDPTNPQALVDALGVSGFGGLANFMSGGFTGLGPMETWKAFGGVTGLAKEIPESLVTGEWDEDKMKELMYKAGVRAITPINGWWTRAVQRKYLRDQILEIGRSRAVEKIDEEMGREPLWRTP